MPTDASGVRERDPGGWWILVVDDSGEVREVMCDYLRGAGYEAVGGDGRQALRILREAPLPPSLVLLDWMMPDVGGLDIMHRIHTDPRTQGTQVVIVTGLGARTATERELLSWGALRVLRKPVSGKDLLAIVAEARRRGRRSTSGLRRRVGRVLIVDDEFLLGNVLAELLSSMHEVEVVTEARDAVHRIVAGPLYDVVLCDVSMPGTSGIDIHAEVVRTVPEQGDAFVFMTAGVTDPSLLRRLVRLPNPTVEKPFELDRVERLVDERVQARRTDRAVGRSPS